MISPMAIICTQMMLVQEHQDLSRPPSCMKSSMISTLWRTLCRQLKSEGGQIK